MQGRRDRHRRRWNGRSHALCCALALRFQHRFGHFLYEQRNAIGALDDFLPNVRWHWLVASNAVDHRFDFAPRQPIEGEGGDVWLSDPRRLELWPEGYEQQHGKVCDPVHSPTEQFQARGVGPMCVLKDHQHRIFACKRLDLRMERFQRFLPTLLWCQFERGITSVIRQREHFGKECRVLTWRRTLRQ